MPLCYRIFSNVFQKFPHHFSAISHIFAMIRSGFEREQHSMDKNFTGQNLNGRSFREQDLRGVDFSGCQLRSCDFRDTDLTGAKFCRAQMGVD